MTLYWLKTLRNILIIIVYAQFSILKILMGIAKVIYVYIIFNKFILNIFKNVVINALRVKSKENNVLIVYMDSKDMEWAKIALAR